MDAPLVTVVIPTRGTRASLPRAVESCWAQSQAAEVVVALDGTTNEEAARKLLSGCDVTVDVGPSAGVSATRNRGARTARGEWLTFLDDDDRLAAGWLEACRSHLNDPTADLILGTTVIDDGEAGEEVPARFTLDPASSDLRMLAASWVVRRSVFAAAGGFDEVLRYSENTELGFRLSSALANRPDSVRLLDSVAVHMDRSPTRQRVAEYGLTRAEAAERILEIHGERFASPPGARAGWLRIISHGNRKVDRSKSRHFALFALRADPRDVKNWQSLAASILGRGRNDTQ